MSSQPEEYVAFRGGAREINTNYFARRRWPTPPPSSLHQNPSVDNPFLAKNYNLYFCGRLIEVNF